MPRTYQWQLSVRSYESDQHGEVQDYYYIHYLQETATQASAEAGYPMQWYLANQRLWLLRTLTVRYFQPALQGDRLTLYSWVSDFRRVQSHREYSIQRGETPILRARGNWVYMDMCTMQPTRIPESFDRDFGVHHPPEAPPEPPITDLQALPQPLHSQQQRQVEPYEIDVAGHVNNGVYPRWLQSAAAALWQRLDVPPPRLLWRRLEYRQPAQASDPITLESQLSALAPNACRVQHRIRQASTQSVLVEDEQVYALDPAQHSALEGAAP